MLANGHDSNRFAATIPALCGRGFLGLRLLKFVNDFIDHLPMAFLSRAGQVFIVADDDGAAFAKCFGVKIVIRLSSDVNHRHGLA